MPSAWWALLGRTHPSMHLGTMQSAIANLILICSRDYSKLCGSWNLLLLFSFPFGSFSLLMKSTSFTLLCCSSNCLSQGFLMSPVCANPTEGPGDSPCRVVGIQDQCTTAPGFSVCVRIWIRLSRSQVSLTHWVISVPSLSMWGTWKLLEILQSSLCPWIRGLHRPMLEIRRPCRSPA